jgi:hypothetical protein
MLYFNQYLKNLYIKYNKFFIKKKSKPPYIVAANETSPSAAPPVLQQLLSRIEILYVHGSTELPGLQVTLLKLLHFVICNY